MTAISYLGPSGVGGGTLVEFFSDSTMIPYQDATPAIPTAGFSSLTTDTSLSDWEIIYGIALPREANIAFVRGDTVSMPWSFSEKCWTAVEPNPAPVAPIVWQEKHWFAHLWLKTIPKYYFLYANTWIPYYTSRAYNPQPIRLAQFTCTAEYVPAAGQALAYTKVTASLDDNTTSALRAGVYLWTLQSADTVTKNAKDEVTDITGVTSHLMGEVRIVENWPGMPSIIS